MGMSKLNKKDLQKIKSELSNKGIYNVIDAQNQKEHRRRMKGIKIETKSVKTSESIEEDPVLQQLSMNKDQINSLIKQLSKSDDETKIEDIDWKNVRNI